jgi:hypothetical protein
VAVLTGSRRPSRTLVVVLGLVLVAIVGVIVVVQMQSGSDGRSSVANLKATLDRVPLPAGAALVDEHAIEGHADVESLVSRRYRLATGNRPTAAIRAAIEAGGYRIVNPHTGEVDPSFWNEATSDTTGDIYVVPSGTASGRVEMTWRDARLDLSVQPG